MKSRGVPDFFLLFLAILLVGFGILMVLSASSIFAHTGIYTSKGCDYCKGDELYFVKRQVMFLGVGIIGMLFAMNMPFAFYKRNFLLICFVCLFLLVIVLIPGIGRYANGARSWIPLGGFNMQPSEFAKIGLAIYLAAIISKKGERFLSFKTGLFPALVVIAIFFILIAIEPDMGGAVILLGTAGVVLICGGARLGHLFMLTVPPFVLFFIGYIMTKGHALDRLLSYRDPWSDPLYKGYQLTQSFMAIARGGMNGTGYGKGIQKYLYLPEAHTDFIFSVIAEEFGFIGTSLFLLVFLTFILRGVHICLRSKDMFASLAGIGVITMITIQAVINIGGATGALPISGVPLPFISYGGSSLLVCMIGTGILLNVSREVNRQKNLDNHG
ncbi:UNVERIFIED_CONTAM: cell division protein FtsW [Brevibacillus sp. OAP136]